MSRIAYRPLSPRIGTTMRVADKHLKWIELATNLLLVITSILLVAVLARNLLYRPDSKQTQTASPPTKDSGKNNLSVGTQLRVPELQGQQGKQTLILALSTSCRYCTESAPFYRRLRAEVDSRTQVVAVFPQTVERSRNYLTDLGVTVDQVIQSPLASISVSATPTLILVSDEGKVIDSWRGKLPVAAETEVMSRLR
jgi:thioredoxin-related protein